MERKVEHYRNLSLEEYGAVIQNADDYDILLDLRKGRLLGSLANPKHKIRKMECMFLATLMRNPDHNFRPLQIWEELKIEEIKDRNRELIRGRVTTTINRMKRCFKESVISKSPYEIKEGIHAVLIEAETTDEGLNGRRGYPEDRSHRVCIDQVGELLRDSQQDICWVQHNKKYYLSNLDVVHHMIRHRIPGWGDWRGVSEIPLPLGPVFYHKNSDSDGLLLKVYKMPDAFLIKNAQKHKFSDEYSFENFKYRSRLLEWEDVICVTDEIVYEEFPSGQVIHITPELDAPADGAKLDVSNVTLICRQHKNSAWGYHIQVALARDFASLQYDHLGSSHVSVINGLDPGKYFWRVRGVKTGRQPSQWSEIRSFEMV